MVGRDRDGRKNTQFAVLLNGKEWLGLQRMWASAWPLHPQQPHSSDMSQIPSMPNID
jgi:hypothetical protein